MAHQEAGTWEDHAQWSESSLKRSFIQENLCLDEDGNPETEPKPNENQVITRLLDSLLGNAEKGPGMRKDVSHLLSSGGMGDLRYMSKPSETGGTEGPYDPKQTHTGRTQTLHRNDQA